MEPGGAIAFPEALGALDVVLTEAELEAIDRAVPPELVAGERYPSYQFAYLDSERKAD